MTIVHAERKGNRIVLRSDYDPDVVRSIREIAGRRFSKADNDPHWTVPLDLSVCRQMRSLFGDDLMLGSQLIAWGRQEVSQEQSLSKIATADSAELARLQHKLPSLYRAVHLGPAGIFMSPEEADEAMAGPGSYQTADIKFLVESPCPLNGNQQGLGKTLELIGAVYEADMEVGSHLVIAPLAAIDATWPEELERWQMDNADNVGVWSCLGGKAAKQKAIDSFMSSDKPVKWLLVNPQMIQFRKTDDEGAKVVRKAATKEFSKACHCRRTTEAHWHYVPAFPELFDVEWNTITIDECHKGSIRNHRSLTSMSINNLKSADGCKRVAMSGTPMKKQGSDIWGILHWLRPQVFTSYWSFANQFFEVTNNGYGSSVGGLLSSKEQEFFRFLTPYVLRRTKSECLPWLPPKQYVDVYVTMSGKQDKQYRQMEANGAAQIADEEISTTSILAEMTRLRQFSNSFATLSDDNRVIPTRESAKIEALFEKMDETGIFDDNSDQKTIIFSQFREMIELVHGMVAERGVKCEIISGSTNKTGQRKAIKESFQNGDTRVLCIVTTAGGVSLTLDAADSAHFIDESFAPDDDEQAEDRIHRASRNHNVTIYRYRSRNSIDDVIAQASIDKKTAHERILDIRRSLVNRQKGE